MVTDGSAYQQSTRSKYDSIPYTFVDLIYEIMRFIVTYENTVFNGQAQYLKDEHSFFYAP